MQKEITTTMMMKFSKPISFFDLETTSAKVATARIVSISIVNVYPDGTTKTMESVVNPEIPIPPESSAIHGITDDMVLNAPVFKQIAKSIKDFIGDNDLGGYNESVFDIPILLEEYLRIGGTFDLEGRLIYDPSTIFKKKEERTLTAALDFFCGEKLEGAHEATADVIASIKVFFAQLQYYSDLAEMTPEELAKFSEFDGPEKIDIAGRFVKDSEGDAIFSGGKNDGKKVFTELNYLNWMNNENQGIYTLQTKAVGKRMYDYYIKKK